MDSECVPSSQIPTPFLRVDFEQLLRNISHEQAVARDRRAHLRPHFKAHKCLRIAKLQREAGAIGLSCATLEEARILHTEGFEDTLIAYPVIPDQGNIDLIRSLSSTRKTILGVSSAEGARRLGSVQTGVRLRVAIEIDVGCKRTGVPPNEALSTATLASSCGLEVVGIFSYPGQAYQPGRSKIATADEVEGLKIAFDALRNGGFEKVFVSAGSTPTFRYGAPGQITEYRPGTYVFGDCQQLRLGSVTVAEIALTVESTVVQADRERVVIDAGGKALGRDCPTWLDGFGLAPGFGKRIQRLYDHHGVLPHINGLKVSDRVQIIPNNSNSAVNQHNAIWVDMGATGLVRWEVDARTN